MINSELLRSPWVFLSGLMVALAVVFFLRKLNISKWLWFGLGFLALAGLAAYKFLDSEIFWGVFIASLLGFFGQILTEKWLEDKEVQKQSKETTVAKKHVREVLRLEMEQNFKIAKVIHAYLNDYRSLSDNDLKQRRDALFYRFSTVSKDALWNQIVEALEPPTLKEVQEIYSEFTHLNHLLDTVCEYLSRNMKVGHLHQDYKGVLDTHPWSIQLFNALAQCLNKKDAVIKEIQ